MASILKFRVRTYECDSYNHVNNANYLHYLEWARYEYLKDIGFDYPKLLTEGYGVYIARVEIDYKRPALVDEEIQVETLPLKKGAVSGVLSQRITRGSDIIAEAKVTWASVDTTGAPARLPPEYDLPGLAPAK
ncbi:MAG: acyl-CoA thioesterase [Spirochaetaceae bacterium]|jgi:acyl-CoA thioester hydrolase|nr:acyl-CoA thioesterase [Spirochaetaceae bacterium]